MKSPLIIGSLLLVTTVVVLGSYYFTLSNSTQVLVISTMDSLDVGMSRSEVKQSVQELGWTEQQIGSLNEDVLMLKTPHKFGAKNWILYLSFEENKLTALGVRTSDSATEHPEGAPEDIGTFSYWPFAKRGLL